MVTGDEVKVLRFGTVFWEIISDECIFNAQEIEILQKF
jgi:hypothetical protein